jgi:NTP pyrophosphatase (non-canonical NTP hydrolase)
LTSPTDPNNQPGSEPGSDPIETPDGQDTTTSQRQQTSQSRRQSRRKLRVLVDAMREALGEISRVEEAFEPYTTMDIGQEELIDILADLRFYAIVSGLDYEMAHAEAFMAYRQDLLERLRLGLLCPHGQMMQQTDPALAENEIARSWNECARYVASDRLHEQVVQDLHATVDDVEAADELVHDPDDDEDDEP